MVPTQMQPCLCLLPSAQRKQLSQYDPETAELVQKHKTKCTPACICHLSLSELLNLCVNHLICCPVTQSKLIYLLEFCAVLILEFRLLRQAPHWSEAPLASKPTASQHIRRQVALWKQPRMLFFKIIIKCEMLFSNFLHWDHLISCPLSHPLAP